MLKKMACVKSQDRRERQERARSEPNEVVIGAAGRKQGSVEVHWFACRVLLG